MSSGCLEIVRPVGQDKLVCEENKLEEKTTPIETILQLKVQV